MEWRGKENMIDGKYPRVLLATPAIDFKLDVEHVKGLIAVLSASGGTVQPYWLTGNSNISEGRNRIAHFFLRHTPCDVLVSLDSDIIFSAEDFDYIMEGDADIVIGPYARKVLGKPPVEFGFGFTRIHRRVFQKLADWMIEAPAGEGPGEIEALPRFFLDGEMAVHYHHTGASEGMQWFGEDTGFYHWCALNNISMRQEKRTRLGHVGRLVYRYPDQIPGWAPVDESGQ